MSKYVKLETSYDYADEFDVPGYTVVTSTRWEQMKIRLIEYFAKRPTPKNRWEHVVEIYFGTNEALSFSSAEEVINGVSITPVNEEQYKVLSQLGMTGFGLSVEEIVDRICEDDDYEDDDE